MSKCLEESCEKVGEKRGYCATHYAYRRRHGLFGGKHCKQRGCTKIAVTRGWCVNHYQRWREFGTPEGVMHTRTKKKHPLYATWCHMRRRCRDPKDYSYKHYGARGIKVCSRWETDFWNFAKDMGPRPSPQHSIDRIDNDGDYFPENCRWATKQEQSQNRGDFIVLTEEVIVEARRRHTQWGDKVSHIALSLNVSEPALRAAIKGETWANIQPVETSQKGLTDGRKILISPANPARH